MNELKRIHIAKVSYEIEKDAHDALRTYLKEIESRVSVEVASEVEGRITEILAERGTHKDGVIVKTDVDAVISQLGTPDQFSDDDEIPAAKASGGRQLMRDTNHALIGGVAAGLGSYFGVDPLLFRIAFLVLLFAGGGGFFIYLVAWLIIPEAKSDADRLRMQGKEVTVDALARIREGVSDVSGRLGGGRLGAFILSAFRFLIGFGLVSAALTALLSFGVGASLVLRYPLYGEFPSQAIDYVIGGLAGFALLTAAGFALWLAVLFLRGTLPGLHSRMVGYGLFALSATAFLASLGTGIAFLPEIRQRYADAAVTEVRNIPMFQSIMVEGEGTYRYVVTDKQPRIEIPMQIDGSYPSVTSEVVGGTLKLVGKESDMSGFSQAIVEVTIYGPALDSVSAGDTVNLRLPSSSTKDNFRAVASDSADVYYAGSSLKKIDLKISDNASFSASRAVAESVTAEVGAEANVYLGRAGSLEAKLPADCFDPVISLYGKRNGEVRVNGEAYVFAKDEDEGCVANFEERRQY